MRKNYDAENADVVAPNATDIIFHSGLVEDECLHGFHTALISPQTRYI